MARRFCAGCGQQIAPGFRVCPKCGRVAEAEKPDFRMDPPQERYAPRGGAAPRRGAPRGTGSPNRNINADAGGRGRPIPRQQSYSPDDRLTYEPQRINRSADGQRRPASYQPNGGRDPQPVIGGDIYADRQRRAEDGYGYYGQPRRSEDIYAERQRRVQSYPQTAREMPKLPPRTAPKQKRTAAKQQARAEKGRSGGAFSKFLNTSSKVVRVIITTVKIAVLLAVIYGCFFLIEVYRVKLTPYPYSTSMRMSRTNFGQAISAYYGEGHWIVNPFTLKCSYKGQTRHNEEMEIVFNARVKVELAEIMIDGEPLEQKAFESKVMGMFI